MFAGCHEHKFTDATCYAPKTCTVCGETEGEKLEHIYNPATCKEPSTCARCGDTVGEALPHNFMEATFDAPMTCSDCGLKVGERLERPKVKIKDIVAIIGLNAECQSSADKCLIDIEHSSNPYDVEYNYGEEYEIMVEKCDWSHVFDAEYYKKTFPLLALQYNNDDKLLLRHFQTVGIHEGRQGCEEFNVGAYLYNCSDEVYEAFNQDYEGYYFYYMLYFDEEKNVNTVNAKNGKKVKKQYKNVLTYQQKLELQNINKYRTDVETDKVEINGELNALANYRAYIQVKENWAAHDWSEKHIDELNELIINLSKTDSNYGENTVNFFKQEIDYSNNTLFFNEYFNSPEHYEIMVNPKYKFAGVSNTYYGLNNGNNTFTLQHPDALWQGSQFDIYLTDIK